MALNKIRDHWSSFLDEIEAPMWVDLTLESADYNQGTAEDWFNTTHQFHQCSSHQLKCTFYNFSEETAASADLQGPFSPKLPSSVSRSRGKDHRGKKLECHNSDRMFHQRQRVKVLGGKSLFLKPASQDEIKPRLSMKKKGYSTSGTSLILGDGRSHSLKPVATCRSSATSIATGLASTKNSARLDITFKNSQPQQQRCHPKKLVLNSRSSASSVDASSKSPKNRRASNISFENNQPREQNAKSSSTNRCSSSTSTDNSASSNITFESSQPQQKKLLDISGQAIGNTRGILSVMRSSLRKSCVTRQASRIAVKRDAEQIRDCTYSSGKSSISSSSNPCDDANAIKLKTRSSQESTLDSINAVTMVRTAKSLRFFSDVPKMPILVEKGKSNSGKRAIAKLAKVAGEKTTQSKEQPRSNHTEGSQPLGDIKQQCILRSRGDKGCLRSSKLNKLDPQGKENVRDRATAKTRYAGKPNGNADKNRAPEGIFQKR